MWVSFGGSCRVFVVVVFVAPQLGEVGVLCCLFVWEEGTTGAGMAAGGPILAPGIKQEDLHHQALEQLPGLAYCINDNPPLGKRTIHLSFLSSSSCSMLCHVEMFHFDLDS